MKEFIYNEQNKNGELVTHRFETLIPPSLYKKYYDTRIAKEIFFIEACRDLKSKIESGNFYDLIRASAILRQFFIDNNNEGVNNSLLQMVSQPYNWTPIFECSEIEMRGTAFSSPNKIGETARKIKEKNFTDFNSGQKECIKLLHQPYKKYHLEDFLHKNCVKIIFENKEDIIFSVHNIIYLVANFNGGVHVDPLPNISFKESFFLGEFNPLVLNNRSRFLKLIHEISIVTLDSLKPLIFEVAKNLHNTNKSLVNAEASIITRAISSEELDKL